MAQASPGSSPGRESPVHAWAATSPDGAARRNSWRSRRSSDLAAADLPLSPRLSPRLVGPGGWLQPPVAAALRAARSSVAPEALPSPPQPSAHAGEGSGCSSVSDEDYQDDLERLVEAAADEEDSALASSALHSLQGILDYSASTFDGNADALASHLAWVVRTISACMSKACVPSRSRTPRTAVPDDGLLDGPVIEGSRRLLGDARHGCFGDCAG